MDRKQIVPLLLVLMVAQHANALKFTFTAIGTGANKGVRASVVVTINQSIRSLVTDGVDSTIAPTVTYSLKLSKAARVGYQAALFGATGTFSDPATAHAVRFGEVTAASAIPPKGFGGNAFDILPECTPICGSGRWCYKTDSCDCSPSYAGECTAGGSAGGGGGAGSPVCTPACVAPAVCYNAFTADGTKPYCSCDGSGGTGSGPDCSQPSVCTPACTNGGTCRTRTLFNYLNGTIWQEPYCTCTIGFGGIDCSIPVLGRRLFAASGGDGEEARAVAAIAKSLRAGEGDGAGAGARAGRPREATEAERQWGRLEGLMGRLCDGDIGVALIKDTGVTPAMLVKLPTIYTKYYCNSRR